MKLGNSPANPSSFTTNMLKMKNLFDAAMSTISGPLYYVFIRDSRVCVERANVGVKRNNSTAAQKDRKGRN